MTGFTIGDFYLDVQTDAVPFYYYHRAVYWPAWFTDEPVSYTHLTLPTKA